MTARDASEALAAIVSSQTGGPGAGSDVQHARHQRPRARAPDPRDRNPDLPCIVITGYGGPEQVGGSAPGRGLLVPGEALRAGPPGRRPQASWIRPSSSGAPALREPHAAEPAAIEVPLREHRGHQRGAAPRVLDMVAKVAEDREHGPRSPARAAPARSSSPAPSTTTATAPTGMFVTVNCGAIPRSCSNRSSSAT